MSEDPQSSEIYALLDDKYARAILRATDTTAKSAKELSDECDASLPTVYRRTERLIDCGLLEEETKLEDEGHHHSVYKARLKRLTIELENNELTIDIEERPAEKMADRFTNMWGEL